MNLCFFGSAPIAVSTLEEMINNNLNIRAVFTQPDRPAGRGGRMTPTAVKECALKHDLPVHAPEKINNEETAELLRQYKPDLVVVVAYGHLIPQILLDIPTYGFINMHASILPKYRGAAPVPYAILNGEKETGVTVFRLNNRFDEGDILEIARIPIDDKDTTESLLRKLAPLGAELVCKVVGEFEAGWQHPVPQSEEEASKAPKMNKDDGLINWEEDPATIDRKVRAYQPWPLCYTFIGEGKKRRRLVITEVEQGPEIKGEPGAVQIFAELEGLYVSCGNNHSLKIIRIKPEGKREMSAKEFMRGAHLEKGVILG